MSVICRAISTRHSNGLFGGIHFPKGYLDPAEFASFGLLGVAFVSLSSPSIEMRQLGYECLAIYKAALEKYQKKKDLMRLRLLLTYMQNGIEEPWQQVPSVIALFAAEASFLLLDPSNDHHATLSKHLMHSSKVHMKYIPLFDAFFQSNSVNFRTERLWILRLACAGLNLDKDAQIYIRNSIVEKLMAFYSSPLADNDSKDIILQIVKKSVKFHKMVHYLVESCGLFSWLSSVFSISRALLSEDVTKFFSRQLVIVIEVVMDVVSSKDMIEWLQNLGLEQLGEFASQLYQHLAVGLKLIKENVGLVDSMLHIVKLTLQISQKRKLDQPHFTPSFEGLFLIYQACDACGGNSELGLEAILMSTPPTDIFLMEKGKLSSFFVWAISTALRREARHHNTSIVFPSLSKEEPSEESLLSKLLRWLVGAVIIGKSSRKADINSDFSQRSSSKHLLSFLEHTDGQQGTFDCEELIAATMLYLQQLLGLNCSEIPSVVSALYLLLPRDTSGNSGFVSVDNMVTTSLCSRIRPPIEANPAWRWSFEKPWKDLSVEVSEIEMMEEHHACQNLLVIFSDNLGKKSVDPEVVLRRDVETSSLFEWKRSIVETKM